MSQRSIIAWSKRNLLKVKVEEMEAAGGSPGPSDFRVGEHSSRQKKGCPWQALKTTQHRLLV